MWHVVGVFRADRTRSDGLTASCALTGDPVAEPAPVLVPVERPPLDLAYLAGVFDSDGYITAQISARTRYVGAHVGIAGTRREPHDLAAALFGGRVNAYRPHGDREGHRLQFNWQRAGRQAVPVIEAVLPFLRVKRDQAHAALELQERVEEARRERQSDDPFPWFGPDFDPFAHLVEFARVEVQELNIRRTRLGSGRVLDKQLHDAMPERAR